MSSNDNKSHEEQAPQVSRLDNGEKRSRKEVKEGRRGVVVDVVGVVDERGEVRSGQVRSLH